MQRNAVRERLTFPIAAAMALSLVTVPHTAGSEASRLVEVSAVRLQAEVTTYLKALDDAAVPGLAGSAPTPAAAAAEAASSTANSWPYNPSYSFLDNIVYNLPPKIRALVIPPLYAFAWVLGAAMAVPMLVIAPIVKLFKPSAAAARTVRPAAAIAQAAPAIPAVDPIAAATTPRAEHVTRAAGTGSAHTRALGPAPAASTIGQSPAGDRPTPVKDHTSSPRTAKRSVR